MDIKKANEILSRNKLNLRGCGMEKIPVKTVEIEEFEINQNPIQENGITARRENAILIGMITKKKARHIDSNFLCLSFMVQVHYDFHYCDYYSEAMQVIQALRVVNNWVYPYDDSTPVSVTF